MGHPVGLQSIALIITVALCFGLLFERMKQPAILGYIIAGIALGPSGFGYIDDPTIIELFGDFGVLMVLFVVGMSLNIQSFRKAMGISIAVFTGQLFLSLGLAFAISFFMGWGIGLSLLVAFVLCLSSTAVAVKMLEASKEVETNAGRLSLGVLIAQDLAIVPMILILRDLNQGIDWMRLGLKLLGAFAILTAFVWFLARPRRVPLFVHFSPTRPELPSLVSLSFCFGFATITGLLGLSVAYGAFLAGLVLGNLRERPLMQQVIMPIYSVLVMTFFLSVGLFINVSFIWQNIYLVAGLSAAILLFKTFMNVGTLCLLKQPWPTTFLAGVVLSQLGEFAFLLTSVAYDTQLINEHGRQMLVTLTAISLGISPLWLSLSSRLGGTRLRTHATFAQTAAVYKSSFMGWRRRFFSRKSK